MNRAFKASSLAVFFFTALTLAQDQAPKVTRQTVMVPMRDGVKLATDVYLPDGKGPFPVVLMRNPYNKTAAGRRGAKQTEQDVANRQYALVHQDTRGRFASEGKNLPFEGEFGAEHQDGHDTLEWITKQPWCNGKIGTMGGSALGIAQIYMAADAPPGLVCQHIVVGCGNPYQDFVFPGGIFKSGLAQNWLKVTKFDAQALKNWTSHSTYDDYWRQREMVNRFSKINVPAVHIGGYYDIFAQGTIDAFVGYQTRGGPKARGKQKLLMGPWTHAVLIPYSGELKYDNAKAPPNNVHDAFRWFDHYLKGVDNGIDREAAVTYYVMGDPTDPKAPGKEWRTADTWPPAKTTPTSFYLHADRKLSSAKPADDKSLTFAYDPKNPVPTIGGLHLGLPRDNAAGTKDQRPIENRPDVLVFSSEPLAEPLEVTGLPEFRLWAASDAPDTDFFVKFCDVYPDGRSINISEGQIRARFRESFQQEKLMQPGTVYPFTIPLSATSIIINKGHRLRVHVTSSNSPGFDPNPNTGEVFRASDKTRVAHNTVYMDAGRPSHIVLPVAAANISAR